MQQPIIEFTNFHEFESVLNELKELTEKQGKIIEKQAKQIKKIQTGLGPCGSDFKFAVISLY